MCLNIFQESKQWLQIVHIVLDGFIRNLYVVRLLFPNPNCLLETLARTEQLASSLGYSIFKNHGIYLLINSLTLPYPVSLACIEFLLQAIDILSIVAYCLCQLWQFAFLVAVKIFQHSLLAILFSKKCTQIFCCLWIGNISTANSIRNISI